MLRAVSRAMRQRRAPLVVCSLFCVLVFLHSYSNVEDLLYYFFSSDHKILPLSIHCNMGRLGNQMCTYATLYGLSVLNGRRPFSALSCNSRHLGPIFDGLTTGPPRHSAAYIAWNAWDITPYLRPEDSDIPLDSNFIKGYLYPCSYTFFDHVGEEIRREFHFAEHLRQHARRVLLKANVDRAANATYVGMHVRRGDYQKRWLDAFGAAAVNMEYFEQATEYFRSKYQPVIFVLVSDDRLWCIQHLSARFGVYVADDAASPAHDMAVMAACNHSIITYGTFGFWGAYLAGGEVVYFDKFLVPNSTFGKTNFVMEKMYPPRWIGIATVNESDFEKIPTSSTEPPRVKHRLEDVAVPGRRPLPVGTRTEETSLSPDSSTPLTFGTQPSRELRRRVRRNLKPRPRNNDFAFTEKTRTYPTEPSETKRKMQDVTGGRLLPVETSSENMSRSPVSTPMTFGTQPSRELRRRERRNLTPRIRDNDFPFTEKIRTSSTEPSRTKRKMQDVTGHLLLPVETRTENMSRSPASTTRLTFGTQPSTDGLTRRVRQSLKPVTRLRDNDFAFTNINVSVTTRDRKTAKASQELVVSSRSRLKRRVASASWNLELTTQASYQYYKTIMPKQKGDWCKVHRTCYLLRLMGDLFRN